MLQNIKIYKLLITYPENSKTVLYIFFKPLKNTLITMYPPSKPINIVFFFYLGTRLF